MKKLLLSLLLLSQPQFNYAAEDREILYWVAPMDANYRRDKPGQSPMGMDLVPVYADEAGGDGSVVSISPEVVQNLGVRTAVVEQGRLWRAIDTVGYINYDESKVSHIHLRTKGWIENLVIKSEGELVNKGQRLFDLYSPELVNGQEEYIQALTSKNKRLISASRERLKALGISDGQIKILRKTRKVKQNIAIYAPQDGVVSSLLAREGMYVMPSKRVMALADLSSVWLLADVFERQADWVKTGQTAEVTMSYLPGKTWEGKVTYIYPDLDAKTRTLKVRLQFENTDGSLKPNMYANVKIYGGAKNEVLMIPLEALIRTGRENRVIIALGEGKFEARPVKIGIESGDWMEIQSGLKAGESVVTSGQFLLDSEASVKASFARMSPGNEPSMKPETTRGFGVIKSIMPDHGMLNLEHDPIPDLGWPSMQMDFTVVDGVSLDGLSVGQGIDFELEKQGDNYRISRIHQLGEAAK
jgi:Cu(I)/Ag(I) efflux system membrane fusion protein